MLNHLRPTTGDSHVAQINLAGDCTQCCGDCFCTRAGGGISRRAVSPTSSRTRQVRTAGSGKVDDATGRNADAFPDQIRRSSAGICGALVSPSEKRRRFRQRQRSRALPLSFCEHLALIMDGCPMPGRRLMYISPNTTIANIMLG